MRLKLHYCGNCNKILSDDDYVMVGSTQLCICCYKSYEADMLYWLDQVVESEKEKVGDGAASNGGPR